MCFRSNAFDSIYSVLLTVGGLYVNCSKATTLERTYGPAWIAYGHSFAVESEHDQAMAAYFTAAQLMKGCVLKAYFETNNQSMTTWLTESCSCKTWQHHTTALKSSVTSRGSEESSFQRGSGECSLQKDKC